MTKMEKLSKQIIETHLLWAENIRKKLKILVNFSNDSIFKLFLENFNDLIIGEDLKEIINKFSNYDLKKEIKLNKKKIKTISKEVNKNNKKEKIETINNLYKKIKLDKIEEITIVELKKEITKTNKIIDYLNELKNKRYVDYILKEIFCYEKFSLDDKWNRHIFLKNTGITVCPYCNRQYITFYSTSDGKNRSTADLDHFYSQKKFPYLSLNIHNFVPSCPICNRNLKKEQEIGIYPYTEEFGKNAKFKILNFKKDIVPENLNFKVIIEYDKINEKIKKNIEVFKLKEIYEVSHNKYILDMLNSVKINPKEHIESIANVFTSSEEKEKEIIKKLDEISKQAYRYRIKNNEPLSKLTKDILDLYNIKI